jgi:putative redox protein
LDCKFVGYRADDHPHRFLRIELHFAVGGEVPAAAVERAITLSRERYCSVWHSMRQDIELTTTFEVQP